MPISEERGLGVRWNAVRRQFLVSRVLEWRRDYEKASDFGLGV